MISSIIFINFTDEELKKKEKITLPSYLSNGIRNLEEFIFMLSSYIVAYYKLSLLF